MPSNLWTSGGLLFMAVPFLALAVLLLIALISIGRHASQLGAGVALGWVVVVVFAPVVGFVAWFVVGARSHRGTADPALQRQGRLPDAPPAA